MEGWRRERIEREPPRTKIHKTERAVRATEKQPRSSRAIGEVWQRERTENHLG
jgi:hypothetical protein